MKKILLILIIGCFFGATLSAQESEAVDTTKHWKISGVTTLNFSQVSLTNWAAGGDNSYSLNGLMNFSADYKKDNLSWNNTFDLGYGIIKQGQSGVRKTDDKLELMSKLGYKAISDWNYNFMLNFKTQMDKGYKYQGDTNKVKISNFLAPAYLTASLGMEYKPGDSFYLMISPFTMKNTIVSDDSLSAQAAFGVEEGEKIRSELGGFVKIAYKKDIWKNVGLNTKLDLFSNYLENPEKIDVNWEVLLTMKINKYLSANINTLLIYDYDVKYVNDQGEKLDARVQFKELFGIGFSYKF